jgi:hypothetical protein
VFLLPLHSSDDFEVGYRFQLWLLWSSRLMTHSIGWGIGPCRSHKDRSTLMEMLTGSEWMGTAADKNTVENRDRPVGQDFGHIEKGVGAAPARELRSPFRSAMQC